MKGGVELRRGISSAGDRDAIWEMTELCLKC